MTIASTFTESHPPVPARLPNTDENRPDRRFHPARSLLFGPTTRHGPRRTSSRYLAARRVFNDVVEVDESRRSLHTLAEPGRHLGLLSRAFVLSSLLLALKHDQTVHFTPIVPIDEAEAADPSGTRINLAVVLVVNLSHLALTSRLDRCLDKLRPHDRLPITASRDRRTADSQSRGPAHCR